MAQKKIALLQMPTWSTEHPPLALAIVASVLKRKQVEIRCFDFNIDFNKVLGKERWIKLNEYKLSLQNNLLNLLFPERYHYSNEKLEDLISTIDTFLSSCLDELAAFKPDIVAFSVCTYMMQTFCLLMAKKIKKSYPKIRIVFGGAIYSKNLNNDLPLKTGFVDEIVLKGQENEFFEKFKDKDNYGFDPDITYFDFFDLEKYEPTLPMVWTQGCNMKCKFCIDPSTAGTHKTFDIDKIIKQIKFCIKQYNIRTFRLNDSNLNQNPKFLSEVCDRIINEKLDISWGSNFYIYPNIKIGLLRKMAKAGCERLSIGVESGSQKVLDELNKSFSVDVAKDVIKKVHSCGIKAYLYLIIGSPSESNRDYLKTLKLLHELRGYIDAIASLKLAHYIRGSQFYAEAKKNELFKMNIPQSLKDYEEYLPFVYPVKPTFSKSTVTDYRYLANATLNIHLRFKIKKSPLIIENIYYDGKEIIMLNTGGNTKEKNGYCLKIPQDTKMLEALIKTSKKKVKILLDIDYAHYLDKKKKLTEYLNEITAVIDLKLCRPIPKCFVTKELTANESLTQECKDCISYLYLNENEKIVYCQDKFWDYYIKKNDEMTEACKSCQLRENGQCKMVCIQYLANKPLWHGN